MGIEGFWRKWRSKLFLQNIRHQFVNFSTLAIKYGQYRTICKWECIDADNAKIPWYTYPAIEYLNGIDFKKMTVFEYGSGNSSVYWASRAKFVYSVEHDKEWYEKIKGAIADNQVIELCEDKSEYVNAITRLAGKADVIVIDGLYRMACAELVRDHLSEGGIVILDNADWHRATSRYLRHDLSLLQVDFHGFGPINPYTWTTSIFFARTACLQPLMDSQPQYSIAAIKKDGAEAVR
ncbi:MAG: class I SAM-dependent methyltransferase [Nitrospira sp.]|nr:class I SAM-dependent methyltransferase [Nitrospira sp.]